MAKTNNKENEPPILFIKNMVCTRCILSVQAILNRLGITYKSVILGKTELFDSIGQSEIKLIDGEFRKVGFEVIFKKANKIIEEIKLLLLKHLLMESNAKIKLSYYLSKELHYEYSYISNIFSSVEGITIEKYYIGLKIEKVKELLVYEELSLTEIAYKLEYSSVAHLSAQFKKNTGLTPSYFKKLGEMKRKSIDKP